MRPIEGERSFNAEGRPVTFNSRTMGQVPLDYTQPDGTSAAIAMVRVHSAVPHNSPRYRGPVLINPGGPGGSGVDFVAAAGPLLSTIIGPEFDIIGFDPRGASNPVICIYLTI